MVQYDADAPVLIELTVPPAGEADQFSAWYEEQWMPRRARELGAASAAQYTELGSPQQGMTIYTLPPAGSTQLAGVCSTLPGSVLDGEIIIRLPRYEQRVYSPIAVPGTAADLPATLPPVLMGVWWSPSQVEDFHAWYREEHIPLLMQVPGWCAIRRYELVGGTGPDYLALHYLESASAMSRPEHDRAVQTPWRARAAKARIQHERRIFSLRRELAF